MLIAVPIALPPPLPEDVILLLDATGVGAGAGEEGPNGGALLNG